MEIGRAGLEEYIAVKGTGYSGRELVDDQGFRYAYVREQTGSHRNELDATGSRERNTTAGRSINNDWDSFWKHRRKSEKKRLYGIDDTDPQEIRSQELRCAALRMTGSSGTRSNE